ncbi:MAG: DKNYY domain-containing protein [Duncaniella sp.]|uniref:hypothetical protein n=1 Tax=Duncaniella sp. TaxID=2518496 RepID=UPI0023CEFBA8|nr:hypothetical protein [Duncaniella sp.]MDE6090570.1 DKNYY domain-containing protein [Duncaniella sp.]
MKRIDILMIVLLLGVVTWMSYTHEGYDEVNDIDQWYQLNDGEREGWYIRVGDSIYGSSVDEIHCCVKYTDPLKIDAKSLKVLKDCDYVKDKNHVYYPISIVCEDWSKPDSEGCSDIDYFKEYLIEGADPKSFKYLGNDYGIDRHFMYRRGKRIPWDDRIIQYAKKGEWPAVIR